MRNIITILFLICSIFVYRCVIDIPSGAETNTNNTNNPIIGEWAIYKDCKYLDWLLPDMTTLYIDDTVAHSEIDPKIILKITNDSCFAYINITDTIKLHRGSIIFLNDTLVDITSYSYNQGQSNITQHFIVNYNANTMIIFSGTDPTPGPEYHAVFFNKIDNANEIIENWQKEIKDEINNDPFFIPRSQSHPYRVLIGSTIFYLRHRIEISNGLIKGNLLSCPPKNIQMTFIANQFCINISTQPIKNGNLNLCNLQ